MIYREALFYLLYIYIQYQEVRDPIGAATSIPDRFVSVKAAQRKLTTASLTNAFGSNTIDLLVVLPAGVIVAGAVGFNYPRIVPMMMCPGRPSSL